MFPQLHPAVSMRVGGFAFGWDGWWVGGWVREVWGGEALTGTPAYPKSPSHTKNHTEPLSPHTAAKK